MKNKFILGALILFASVSSIYSQVLSNAPVTANINGQNPFLDASTGFERSISGESDGKGLLFPQTDLTKFTFRLDIADGVVFPTYFDGMIVFNAEAGKTVAGNGKVVDVKPGFYYFSNPTGVNDAGITNGEWKPLGGNEQVISQVENPSNKVYETSPLSTKIVDFTVPAGNTSAEVDLSTMVSAGDATFLNGLNAKTLYSLKVLKRGTVGGAREQLVNADVNNYDVVSKRFTNGNGIMYQVLQPGDYRMILEYTK